MKITIAKNNRMKNLKLFLSSFFLSVYFIGNAQSIKENIVMEAGYTYFNRSFLNVGAKYRVDEKTLMIGANALVGLSNDKVLVIPEINVIKYFNAEKFPFPYARLNLSPKTISPQLGFSYLLVEVDAGYGFALDTSSNYPTKGFRAQIRFNFPLTKK